MDGEHENIAPDEDMLRDNHLNLVDDNEPRSVRLNNNDINLSREVYEIDNDEDNEFENSQTFLNPIHSRINQQDLHNSLPNQISGNVINSGF